MRLANFLRLACAATVALASFAAPAQDFPSKPVRIFVPFPAGGIVDLMARAVADGLAPAWGPRVLVENRAGANGMIAIEAAAKSAPDGYTWLMGFSGHVVNPILMEKASYDPIRDFAAVMHVANAPNVVVVPATLPVRTMKEFVDHARARPGKLNYVMPGTGSTNHLSAELLKNVTRIDLVAVGYKGQPPAIPDLMAGIVDVMYATPALVIPHVKSGKLKALAVTSDSRMKALPDTPTLAEAGFADTLVPPWFGIVVPAGTPAPVVRTINEAIGKAMAAPEFADRMEKIHGIPVGGTPEAFDRFLRDQFARWTKLAKEVRIEMKQ